MLQVASARGFAVGCVKVLEGGALVTNYGVPTTTGHLISPRLQFESVQVESEAAFVLVVEKDAVFSRILSEGDLAALPPCVVVTVRSPALPALTNNMPRGEATPTSPLVAL